jgi:hypothetical protein
VTIRNARRGLAKPSSHGKYLAMDIEPADRALPITAAIASDDSDGAIGGLLLTFDRSYAPMIARREEYAPDAFEHLIELADGTGKPLGEFLIQIASATKYDLLAYRIELRKMLGYTSPGYIFHPIELDDGRVAIIAIGSGFEGSGDPAIRSRRQEFSMDRLLSLEESMRIAIPGFDRAGQIGYYAECILGGVHGLDVGDLAPSFEPNADWMRDLASHLLPIAESERERFLEATSLDDARYAERFPARDTSILAALMELTRVE